MTDVISVRFVNRGKKYYFDPGGISIAVGDRIIVETAKGLDIGECAIGNHSVDDSLIVWPLRPVVRIATPDDLRADEANKKLESEAFDICKEKIARHGLDMKLVGVECSFEGSKILFFFTSDGRVDFRELVKDLASVFRTRIELRQIGVRDETKMMGGLGICGRPYCCSQFLNDFEPVSTKMAKTQSMSLNPAKISGSCGRLMCCLRYEQEAYEDLVASIPRSGAFVQTTEGYGNVVQTNILRQKVKVRMDGEDAQNVRLFDAVQVATVPGGRPKPGEAPPDILKYVPQVVKAEAPEDPWKAPSMFAESISESASEEGKPTSRPREADGKRSQGRKKQHGGRHKADTAEVPPDKKQNAGTAAQPITPKQAGKKAGGRNRKNRQPRKMSGEAGSDNS